MLAYCIVLFYIRIRVTKYPVVPVWIINHRCNFSCGVCNISVTLSPDNIVQYSSHTNLLDVFTDCQTESCKVKMVTPLHSRQLDQPVRIRQWESREREGGFSDVARVVCCVAVTGPEPFSN